MTRLDVAFGSRGQRREQNEAAFHDGGGRAARRFGEYLNQCVAQQREVLREMLLGEAQPAQEDTRPSHVCIEERVASTHRGRGHV